MSLIGKSLYRIDNNYYFFEDNKNILDQKTNLKKINSCLQSDRESDSNILHMGKVVEVLRFISFEYYNNTAIKCNNLRDNQLKFLFIFDTGFKYLVTNAGYGSIQTDNDELHTVVQIMGYHIHEDEKYSYYGLDLNNPKTIVLDFKPSESYDGVKGFETKAGVTIPDLDFCVDKSFEQIFNPSTSSEEECYRLFYNYEVCAKYESKALSAIYFELSRRAMEYQAVLTEFLTSVHLADMPTRICGTTN